MSRSVAESIEQYLTPVFGDPKRSYSALRYNCPICDAGGKHNLEINCNETSPKFLKAHCWGCHLRGLRTILAEYATDDSWRKLPELKSANSYSKKSLIQEVQLELPKSCMPFYRNEDVSDYLTLVRKCREVDLIKRRVKYVFDSDDPLHNNIIFPFYNDEGELICFTSQNLATKKYKNHGSTNFVAYKEFINPAFPILITEGIYDCLSVVNSIPLLGTMLNKQLLLYCEGKNVILGLDNNVEVKEEYKAKLEKELLKHRANNVVIYDIGDYKDLNDFYIKDEKQLKNDLQEIYKYFLENE